MDIHPLKSLKLEKIPTSPGVYFFIGKQGRVLYIGKAANLRARIRSYFTGFIGEKTKRLLSESEKIKIKTTDSEIAALIEEASYIKKVLPKYNVLWRDDKNYFFVGITNEEFSRIFITHQPKGSRFQNARTSSFLGPFVSGRALRNVLKVIRQYFPYCTCKKPHKRICLSWQLGLCPGFCCKIDLKASENEKANYISNIRKIKLILSGRSDFLIRELKNQIKKTWPKGDFEKAAKLQRELQNIEKILAHRGLIESLWQKEKSPEGIFEELAYILKIRHLEKLEMYDASMLAGKTPVGAMVVYIDGIKQGGDFRLFKIKNANPQNDPAMIAEIIQRRLLHPEWQYPDLILVDGGISQLNAARKILQKHKINIPCAALSKDKKHKGNLLLFGKPVRQIPVSQLPQGVALFLRELQDEAHRFVISYHRKRRLKTTFINQVANR
ncbi:MAG: GIY-YIG nuclease family protein [Candidatus Paceibacteria bacterium]